MRDAPQQPGELEFAAAQRGGPHYICRRIQRQWSRDGSVPEIPYGRERLLRRGSRFCPAQTGLQRGWPV